MIVFAALIPAVAGAPLTYAVRLDARTPRGERRVSGRVAIERTGTRAVRISVATADGTSLTIPATVDASGAIVPDRSNLAEPGDAARTALSLVVPLLRLGAIVEAHTDPAARSWSAPVPAGTERGDTVEMAVTATPADDGARLVADGSGSAHLKVPGDVAGRKTARFATGLAVGAAFGHPLVGAMTGALRASRTKAAEATVATDDTLHVEATLAANGFAAATIVETQRFRYQGAERTMTSTWTLRPKSP